MTDRRLDGGGSGTVFSSDMTFRFLKNYRVFVQGLGSYTREPNDPALNDELPDTTFDGSRHTVAFDGEQYWGHACYVGLSRGARTWNWDLDYEEYSPTVRTDNGFVTQNNNREASFWTGYQPRPDGKIVESYQLALNGGRSWNFDGVRKTEWIQPGGRPPATDVASVLYEIAVPVSPMREAGAIESGHPWDDTMAVN